MSLSRLITGTSVQLLILRGASVAPTVPVPATATPLDATWKKATDILIGELAWNVTDNRLYSRNEADGIVEVGANASAGPTAGDHDFNTGLPILRPNGAAGIRALDAYYHSGADIADWEGTGRPLYSGQRVEAKIDDAILITHFYAFA